MGMYTNLKENTTTDFTNLLEAEENITVETLAEGYVASCQNVLEMELNWSNMHKAIALDELAYLEENGTEVIYEASKFKSFFDGFVKFFQSVWEKIVAMFNKFMGVINQLVMGDRQFVSTYSKKLADAKTAGFEFEGFEYTTGKHTAQEAWKDMEKMIEAKFSKDPVTETELAAKELDEFNNDKDHVVGELRGYCVGAPCEAKEFGKELFKLFRNGKDTAEKLTKIEPKVELSYITNTKLCTETAKIDLSQTKSIINGIISGLKKQEADLVKKFPGDSKDAKSSVAVRQVSAKTGLTKDAIGILNNYMGAKLSALKARNRQAKAICAKLVAHNAKATEVQHNSAVDTEVETGFGTHMESVIFI